MGVIGHAILMSVFSCLCKIIIILLAVAFVTLFERKILSYRQLRVGPNKVTLSGILQPVLDGVKLLTKEFVSPISIITWGFIVGPATAFVVMLVI